jgi:hypothetical protein
MRVMSSSVDACQPHREDLMEDRDVDRAPGACLLCQHALRTEIDAKLAAGVSLGQISRDYRLPKTSLHRHKAHLQIAALVRDWPARKTASGEVSVIKDSAARLLPIDDLAELLLGFIQRQAATGKLPSVGLIRSWLQAAELSIKTKLSLEGREATEEDLVPFTKRLEAVEEQLRALETKR